MVTGHGKKKAISLAMSDVITAKHLKTCKDALLLLHLLLPSQSAKHLKLPLVAPKMPDVQRANKRWRVPDSKATSSGPIHPHDPVGDLCVVS